MTISEARNACLNKNLLNYEGKPPVAIARNRQNISGDCWLLFKLPDNLEPIPHYPAGVREYLVDVA